MNRSHSTPIALRLLLAAALILSGLSCAPKPPAKGGDSSNRDHYTIAGYEFSAKGETRQKVVARFGPPLSEEKAGADVQYHILTYPVASEPEKLLLLFHGEELLGVFREGSRGSLANTVQAHERNQSGRVVLFSSWFDGKTTSFVASQEQLKNSPKWSPKGGGVAPLSATQAEAIASQWCQRKAPDLTVEPKVRQTLESPSLPGVSFYVVELGAVNPQLRRQVVVLMDGTVFAGESESNKGIIRIPPKANNNQETPMKKNIHALLAVLCLVTGRALSAANVSPPVPTQMRLIQAPPGTNSNAGRGLVGLEQAETPMGKDGSGLGPAGDCQPELLVQNGYKATWSPGSDRLAFGKEGGGISILDLHTRRVTELIREGKDPAWSPDGRYIAYVTEPGSEYVSEVIWLVPAAGGQSVRVGNGGLPAWSKDSRQVYFHDQRSNQVLAVRVDAPDQEPAVFFAKPRSWYPAIVTR